MIESDITSIMSGIIRNSGHNHHPSPQDYRLVTSDSSQLSEDDLPSDLQSLSWLTSVDVPRLQQMASGRMDFSISSQNSMLQQTGPLAGAMHSTGGPGAMIHVQASLPQGILGLNSITSHGTNMSQYTLVGQPPPSLQTQQPLFPPPHTQQVFAIAQSAQQQCNPAALYSASYGSQPQYTQPRLAPHSAQELHPKHYPKPIYSYSCLIAMALKNSKTGSLPVSEIYSFMKEHFPYFKVYTQLLQQCSLSVRFCPILRRTVHQSCLGQIGDQNKFHNQLNATENALKSLGLHRSNPGLTNGTAPDGWKNSVRHNLSLNKCFEKVENKMSSTSRKGCLWALNPAKIDKMEEEMQKWKRKDLAAIHRSMANPEELDKLITDRPESCRRPSKQAEPEASTLSHVAVAQSRISLSQLQPPPIMTLSLQSIPLHHQIQTQARIAPGSPAPAQTPPLHALPDMTRSPLPHHPLSRAPADFLNVTTDMNAEVDALDPSIMDFALQGNLWEEMKDDSFSLDTMGVFSNSPLQLSDYDLGTAGLTPVSSGSDRSFSDLQVTGLYTTYTTLDNVSSSQYMNTQGNKPIALL